MQRGDGRRTHAAGGGSIERVAARALDCRQAHGVDRRLAHRDAGQAAGAARPAEPRQTKQRLVAARREIAVIGAAHLDAGQQSRPVAVREPGAATRAFANGIGHARCRKDVLRESPLSGEIEPGWRSARQGPAPVPPLGDGDAQRPRPPRAEGFRKGGRNSHEAAEHAARLAEIQARVEVLDKGEDVALGLAQRVPPAAAVMVDDDDLTPAAAIFEATTGAFRAVEPPDRRQPLQQRRAIHLRLQPFNLCILLAHDSVLLSGLSGQEWENSSARFLFVLYLAHAIIRNFVGTMIRKLSETSSQ